MNYINYFTLNVHIVIIQIIINNILRLIIYNEFTTIRKNR